MLDFIDKGVSMKNIFAKIPLLGKYLRAKELSKKTIYKFNIKNDALNGARQETQNALEVFGRVKSEVKERTLHPFIEQLLRLDDIELIEQEMPPKELMNSSSVTEVTPDNLEKDHVLAATIAAGGMGATSAAVAFASVGAFASASTGTAIASLAGASATNATLAFLGGGTLAAGGGGIIGGIAVLGGLVTLPVLAVGGYFYNDKINKDLKIAQQDAKTLKKFIRDSDAAIDVLSQIKTTSIRLHRLLIMVESITIPSIKTLTELIDRSTKTNIITYSYYSSIKFIAVKISSRGHTPPQWMTKEPKRRVANLPKKDQQTIENIISVGQILKNILDINIINDDGVVPEEVHFFISTTEKYIQSQSVAV
jgi:hypothetical protein